MTFEYIADENTKRIDSLLSELSGFSRAHIQNAIDDGLVSCDGIKVSSKSFVPDEGQIIRLTTEVPKEVEVEPENIPISIIYQDTDIAVVDKPKGMVVHPAPGNYGGTLVNALLYHIKDLSGINGVLRPGIVHRLDKDTSGLIVIAKNDKAHISLAEQIKEKEAKRKYYALIYGYIDGHRCVTGNIGRSRADRKKMAVVPEGRYAETDFYEMERFKGGYEFIRCELNTGRTHQIRVHLQSIGHSIVGDSVYGRKENEFGVRTQLLHAYELSIRHPSTGELMTFNSPLPEEFSKVLSILRSR